MKYIDSWLKGLGLDHVTPKLKQHNITTPKKLATLTLRDMFEYGKKIRMNELIHLISYILN